MWHTIGFVVIAIGQVRIPSTVLSSHHHAGVLLVGLAPRSQQTSPNHEQYVKRTSRFLGWTTCATLHNVEAETIAREQPPILRNKWLYWPENEVTETRFVPYRVLFAIGWYSTLLVKFPRSTSLKITDCFSVIGTSSGVRSFTSSPGTFLSFAYVLRFCTVQQPK